MVKESSSITNRQLSHDSTSSRESRDSKKRKKNSHSSLTRSVQPKLPKEDVYAEVWKYEEEEALHRDPERDAVLFKETCSLINHAMKDVLNLKLKKNVSSEIADKRISGSLRFVTLKKLNRLEKISLKQIRDKSNDAKQKTDSLHLQLQNLLYEVQHLNKEITKCQEFKSKDEDIQLVPVDEFFEEAPSSFARPHITQTDGHLLKLARLEWELHQRKELSLQCHKLERKKEELAKQIKDKKEKLERLAPCLSDILKSTKPLQEYLKMPLDQLRTEHNLAYHLPKCLYTLYVQVSAFKEAFNDSLISVHIVGDLEDAKSDELQCVNEIEMQDEDSESDGERERGEDNNRQKRHRRKQSVHDKIKETRNKLLKTHALSLQIIIESNGENWIVLDLFYLVQLRIITVKCTVHLNSISGISTRSLLSEDVILKGLYPGDIGETSPNVSNRYQFKRACIDSFQEVIEEVGRPYLWAQKIGGLQFLPGSDNSNERTKVERNPLSYTVDVEQTILAIRRRLAVRIELAKQVGILESGSLPPPPPELNSSFPVKVSSQLLSWQQMSWSDYKVADTTEILISEELVNDGDLFFKATFKRGSAKLSALVALKPDYPLSCPIFTLSLLWNGEKNATTHDAIREMEKELNIYVEELQSSKDQILTCQMHRLLACLDIYVQCHSPDVTKEKIFFSTVRGRNRKQPFKYLCVAGGIFTQR